MLSTHPSEWADLLAVSLFAFATPCGNPLGRSGTQPAVREADITVSAETGPLRTHRPDAIGGATKQETPPVGRGPRCDGSQNLYCIEIPNRFPEVSKLPTR